MSALWDASYERGTHAAAVPLNQYELSSRVANLLSSFRSPLEELITEAESYETAREELLQKEQSLQNRIKEAEVQLEEKDRAISRYGGDVGGKKFTEMDQKLHHLRQELNEHNRKVGQLENAERVYSKELETLDREMKNLNAKADTVKEYKDRYEVLCRLSDAFAAVKDHIVNETKENMQALTWKFSRR